MLFWPLHKCKAATKAPSSETFQLLLRDLARIQCDLLRWQLLFSLASNISSSPSSQMKLSTPLLALAMLQLTGCASIVSGTNQPLTVETRADTGAVAGASCKLSNDKGAWHLTTPGSTTVNRSFEDLSITCEKPDYKTGLLTVKSSTKGMAFGNILLGGVIGAGVDVATGAAYDYPAVITVVMGTNGVVAAPAVAPAPTAPTAPGAAASGAAK